MTLPVARDTISRVGPAIPPSREANLPPVTGKERETDVRNPQSRSASKSRSVTFDKRAEELFAYMQAGSLGDVRRKHGDLLRRLTFMSVADRLNKEFAELIEAIEGRGIVSPADVVMDRRTILKFGTVALGFPFLSACQTVVNSISTGYPFDPILGPLVNDGSAGHLERSVDPALDYNAPRGFPVVASGRGYLSSRGGKGGGGVTLEHRKRLTNYGHMSTVHVDDRYQIRRGKIIGTVGDTGMGISVGVHLHFGIREKRGVWSWLWPEKAGFDGGPIPVYDQVAEMDFDPQFEIGGEKALIKKLTNKDALNERLKRTIETPIPSRYKWRPGLDVQPYYEKLAALTGDPEKMAGYLRRIVIDEREFSYGHPVYTLFLEVNARLRPAVTSLTHPLSPAEALV
jgi:murein DD-endopeptidase MepM/ murein hydrolase activator NlpD